MILFSRNLISQITLLSCLLLVACGDNNETITVESQTTSEAKSFQVKTPDGHIKALISDQGTLEAPTWLPDNFPLPPKCQIKLDGGMAGNTGHLWLTCEGSAEQLTKYFATELHNLEWSLTDTATAVSVYKKANTGVVVTIDNARKKAGHATASLLFSFH